MANRILLSRAKPPLIAALFGLGLSISSSPASEIAGNAVSVMPIASISNPEGRQTLIVGMSVVMGDKIKTGPRGQVELKFTDETKLVVGPNSSMVIESYLLRSESQANNFTVRALGGSFRFITGKSEKSAYKIKTPTATIGVRGTSFDVDIRRTGDTHVVLFSGLAQVCSQSGCVTLEKTCGLAYAPRKEPARVIDDRIYRDGRIIDRFPYIVSQEQLSPDFRVPETGCGELNKAAIKPPTTTAATGRFRDPTQPDNDRDISRPDRSSRSTSRNSPGVGGGQPDNAPQ